MHNPDASAFYIALVLLHEYFTQKAKLLPYTTELSLQTWSVSFLQQSQCNDRTFFKTASLQVRFFTINDIIASIVAVKSGKAFCYDLASGNPCAKFCHSNKHRLKSYVVSAGLTLFVHVSALTNIFITNE